ncbi:hypothetical protein [Reichenbachiella agariperforans]|uniref:Major Facilitator Superfamily protein n=1 Tax=Reichenbachiella agariperforans TaxID=156994 RepID=A0A1M6NYQ2_REIAG|nr:hypothetical protein [Reichenbachiella agariperforans]MBU2916095.1 hypothetical protein [Reichenbachiella agariperforans]SHK00774.1 hypothetical protein SAMN04488028_102470 [Reichenbachiella agariperforans]
MEQTNQVKWPEILSLAALNVALVISWIAYHEYQPVVLENFNFTELSSFLVVAKAFVLVIIPPLAGLTADYFLKKNGKFFVVFTVGIGATAMIFMIVASIIGAGPANEMRVFLPYMILLWLISMNLFISPAYSMIEAFAPAKQLPVVVGFLFLVTELIYALEPVVVALVRFFGDTLTFIVGGVLISVSGYFFHKICSSKVINYRKDAVANVQKPVGISTYVAIIGVGFILGAGKAVLVEYYPEYIALNFPDHEGLGAYFSLGLLAFAAIMAFALSKKVVQMGLQRVIVISFVLLAVGSICIMATSNLYFTLFAGVIVASGFALINLVGIPFAIANLSAKHITYGVGIFIGASELLAGIFEVALH